KSSGSGVSYCIRIWSYLFMVGRLKMRLTSRLINFDLVNDHLRKTEVSKEEFCLDGTLICTALFLLRCRPKELSRALTSPKDVLSRERSFYSCATRATRLNARWNIIGKKPTNSYFWTLPLLRTT